MGSLRLRLGTVILALILSSASAGRDSTDDTKASDLPIEPPGCSLTLDGELYPSLMLTDTGYETHHITVNGAGSCGLTLLLVGCGGNGVFGGAGSGYLNYRRIQVAPGTVLIADVGEKGYNSYVAISGGDTLTAEPGQDAQDWDGGAGYCGGGGEGSPAADGGTGGGDGEDGEEGTGEDVSLYTFTSWTITPGAGGRRYPSYSGGGGGGGGVLVDGEGPLASSWQGQGYGGGGSGATDYRDGLQGVILIEITPA